MLKNDEKPALNTQSAQMQLEPSSKPDEHPAVYVRGFMRITDPETGEVILETAQ